ncbi:hypothetical protein [Terracidiphilus sp.]|uniref:hypothetical protein n=1 Tax=Terracidiphilus sp. TaxID=1964191 RepID=UPI003C1BF0A6
MPQTPISMASPMPISIPNLEEELLRQTQADAPGREFCHAIAELARTGRFAELERVLPEVAYQEMAAHFRRDPAGFIDGWQSLAHEMHQGFILHARQRLTHLTRLLAAGESEQVPAWQEIQRALDTHENNLLRAAIAFELIALIEPATARATHLRECVVASPASEEADSYLDEATRCYFYGLYTACAVMCRSVVEEAVKQKLPPDLAGLVARRYRHTPTLGNLLHEVNNNLQLIGINPDFLKPANRVNDVGRKAVHQGLLSEAESRQCLQDARRALEILL